MPAGAKTVKGMVSTGADPHMPAGAKTVKGMVSTGADPYAGRSKNCEGDGEHRD